MILILSQSEFEFSTIKIIDWLENIGAEYFRINGEDLVNGNLKVQVNERVISLNGVQLQDKEVKVVFNRRWLNIESLINHPVAEEQNGSNYFKVVQSLRNEITCLSQYLYDLYRDAIWVPEFKSVNKLKVLDAALHEGLKVPNTEIYTRKKDLQNFFDTKSKIITKSISDIYPIGNRHEVKSYLTKRLNQSEINDIPDSFYPSLFQAEVEKEYEIRTFYFFGKFYSVAIFSQFDRSTSVDYRNYNYTKPNKTELYMLPHDIELKLKRMMDKIGLNTGSIDIIKSTDGEYYFLEVNPVGQFGAFNDIMSVDIFKTIAEKLKEIDEG